MEYVNALKAAEENGLYLKIVTSVKNFDSIIFMVKAKSHAEELQCLQKIIALKRFMMMMKAVNFQMEE